MGSVPSSGRGMAPTYKLWPEGRVKNGETLAAALTRLDEEISSSERSHPTARLAVVTNEIDGLEEEIRVLESTTTAMTNKDDYAKTIHQLFTSLDLYRRPVLAAENEDFIANVNRKEMRKLELAWLKTRLSELMREKQVLHAQIMRIKALYTQLQNLLESIFGGAGRVGAGLEAALARAQSLREALAAVSARLRAAAQYAHAALRALDEALPAWKLLPVTKGAGGRARCEGACSAVRALVAARRAEAGARRALAARAAPRAARALRLALDYAHTDALHDHKHQRATEIFQQFRDSISQMINSIHQVLLNNLDNLAMTEKDVARYRRELRGARINALAKDGLAELTYNSRTMNKKK